MSENISLKDLLDTTFTINDKGEMVGEFTIKRINMIGDILTNYYNENERLNNIIKEVRELVENGTDFKSIYFKKDNEDLWKVILSSEIKEKYLEILDKGDEIVSTL